MFSVININDVNNIDVLRIIEYIKIFKRKVIWEIVIIVCILIFRKLDINIFNIVLK